MPVGEQFDNIKRLVSDKRKCSSISSHDTMNDTITRIRNAYARKEMTCVYVKKTNFVLLIIDKLFKLGYLGNYTVVDKEIKINLIKTKHRKGIDFIKAFSTPGRRLTCHYDKIPRTKFGVMGKVLLSTDRGILTDTEARQMKTGGLLLMEVYSCQR